jgi:DNA polymerase-3 subunit delta
MKFNDTPIAKTILGRPVPAVYFIFGEEQFYIEQALALIQKTYPLEEIGDLNRDLFFGVDANLEQLINAFNAFPMMADYRLVICRNLDQVAINTPDILIKYLESIPETTVFVATAEKIDKRQKVYKYLLNSAHSFESKQISERDLPAWISAHARQMKLPINEEAVYLLVEFFGNDLFLLNGEMQKLLLYSGKANLTISAEIVADVCGMGRQFSPFQLVSDFIDGKPDKALHNGLRLLQSGESVLRLLSGLYFQFNKLWQIAYLARRKASNSQIASTLKMPEWIIKKEKIQAMKISEGGYHKIFQCLLETDKRAKTTGIKDSANFARLILELQIYLR